MLFSLVPYASATFSNNGGKDDVGPLVGGESFVTRAALAAANKLGAVRNAHFYNVGFRVKVGAKSYL